jgi:hypothetical protein
VTAHYFVYYSNIAPFELSYHLPAAVELNGGESIDTHFHRNVFGLSSVDLGEERRHGKGFKRRGGEGCERRHGKSYQRMHGEGVREKKRYERREEMRKTHRMIREEGVEEIKG